jgi:hypothetical protein
MNAASAAPSTVSPLTAALRAHAAERDARKARLAASVESALTIGDDLENNCRAALGMQLHACVQNQAALEGAVRALRLQVATLGKRAAGYGAAYDALAAAVAVADAGAMDAYLRSTDGVLARIGDNLEWVAGRLTAEE